MCPDCDKPMSILGESQTYPSLAIDMDSDFASVQCMQEGCMSKYFVTTIEKKTGMVIYTSAAYQYRDGEYVPVFAEYKTEEELKK